MAPAQAPARQGSRVLAPVDDHLSVYYDVFDAHGVVLWVRFSGVGFYCIGVEDHDVGFEPIPQQAPVGDSQALGREGGHFADGLG